MIGSLPDQRHGQEVFGSSSAGSFISQVRSAVMQKLDSSTQSRVHSPGERQEEQTNRAQSLSSDLVLPTRRQADLLLSIHWDIVHPLYPFLEKADTLRKYVCLWDGQGEDDISFLCLLNVVFALSCQLNPNIEAEQRERSANTYYERAKALLNPWAGATFEAVQIYLLLGQYFQSTNEPHQCWMIVGAAVRTAQSLGLHLPETTQSITSPARRELMRKVWHGCILMDRVVSMTYGRPPMVSPAVSSAVPFPIAIDEHLLSSNVGQVMFGHGPSVMDFYLETLKLYEVLFDVLTSLDSSTVETSDFQSIERRLIDWDRKLPAHLKTSWVQDNPQDSRFFLRQSVILRQRQDLTMPRAFYS